MPATISEVAVDPVINRARQALYRFTSLALLDPRAGAWEQLDALRNDDLLTAAAELIHSDPAASAEELGKGELPLDELNPTVVFSKLPNTAAALNRQYESTFGLLVSGACPPYETEYINGKFTIQRSHTLADVSGFYSAFGLQVSERHVERHDHIVLQLEFMAFLLGKQLQAIDEGNEDRVAICQEAEERFFREHLSWWSPAFSHLLARTNGDGFYGQVARLLAALITTDRARYVLPVPEGTVQPSQLERPEECEGCGLAES